MKLYKFRSLGNQTDFDRAKQILETGHFWCSKFSELNDPMEGVFFIAASHDSKIADIFSEKNKFMTCSFSAKSAFKNPVMWGYYANGFKGIAIEIEVDEDDVDEINYVTCLPDFDEESDFVHGVKKILTTKLACWKHEHEYRLLKQSDSHSQVIGRVTAVYFGTPYKNTDNYRMVYETSRCLREYAELQDNLLKSCCGIEHHFVEVDAKGIVRTAANYERS